MRRREFITLIGGAAVPSLLWPLVARAQQSIPTVGVVYGVSAAEWADNIASARRGLSEIGFVEGRNVAIEFRWADGQLDRMPVMAAELIARRVAVLLIGGNTAAVRSVVAAAQSTPIVFTTGVDPVEAGVVSRLNPPGGNRTGGTSVGGGLGPKRLGALPQSLPPAQKNAPLGNPNNPPAAAVKVPTTLAAARRLGLEMIVVNGGAESEIETAFATAVQQGADALYVGSDAVLVSRRQQIAAAALRHKLPTIGTGPETGRAGLLMSYGPDQTEM